MASSGAEHTRPLAELRGTDEATFGGKSASLGELIEAAVPVPPGFALAATAFAAFIEDAALGDEVAAAMAGLDPADVAAVRSASERIGARIRAIALPDSLRAELGERYAELAATGGDREPPVAVRSSALGEDSAEATYAGQQETYLWVRGADAVCDAVRDCWASLYSPEAIGYRARLGDADRDPAMGVTVQAMIDAEVSGVMFTCNPVSGDPSTVAINASWGLGLAVVGGEVTPDEYRLNKVTGEITSTTIGPKQLEYRPDPSGSGTVRVEVEPERSERACLGESELGELLEVAKLVRGHFGAEQDIEWALAAPGGGERGPFVLQSRPVTAAGPKRGEKPPRRSAISMVMSTFGADPKPAEEG
jgi:pyruvate,water dikinase